jgi:predicted nucleic acid-binding protein
LKLVIDTNVVAYALLGTPGYVEDCRNLLRSDHVFLAPSLWEAEIANVVWMAARSGVIDRGEAPARLRLATRFRVESVSCRSLWQGALQRALEADVAVYDSLFVELAFRQDLRMVTYDQRLLRAWPRRCRRPAELV